MSRIEQNINLDDVRDVRLNLTQYEGEIKIDSSFSITMKRDAMEHFIQELEWQKNKHMKLDTAKIASYLEFMAEYSPSEELKRWFKSELEEFCTHFNICPTCFDDLEIVENNFGEIKKLPCTNCTGWRKVAI